MKVLKYKIGTARRDGSVYLAEVTMGWNEVNEKIAKKEAHNGEYTIEDDGEPEPVVQPTQEERISELEEALELLLSGVTE